MPNDKASIRQEMEQYIDELADQVASSIKDEGRRLLRSGAVDLENQFSGPCWLPKAIVTVATETASKSYWNHLDKTWVEEVNNLRHF
jgi:hypothetical protein